jgi:hypothetical protein
MKNALPHYNAGVLAVNSKVVGSAPDYLCDYCDGDDKELKAAL